MKQFIWITCLPLILLCSSARLNSSYSNHCEQEYRLLFKEKETDAFWIAEDLYGECSQSNLIQVDLSHAVPVQRVTPLREFGKWNVLESTLSTAIDIAPHTQILPQNGILHIEQIGVKLRTPERNPVLEDIYKRDFHEECAKQWNEAMKEQGINLPLVSGLHKITPKLLYASPNGLYFNYQIERAHYFPEGRLIIIFTKNNFFRCSSEVVTMHGFMILRL
ncbi:MAG: hypothetical protein RMJ44_02060 [Cytophagales bacterium]|nr:hypothetical protein [Bernardetiaceae bacterium]MDW8209844.1 hypothetical protein [Cytophagales bacterium]